MISYRENLQIAPHDLFSTRICATLISYGNQPFIQNWVQEIDSKIVAYLQLIDQTLTVSATDSADVDEIKEFIPMTGAKQVFCDASLGRKLGFVSSGCVMVKKHSRKQIKSYIKQIVAPDYKMLYNQLCTFFPMPPFEDFYLDFSHRVRHGTARVLATQDYKAIAMTGWETEYSAVISAVAVSPESRGKGLGIAAVNALCDVLKDKKIYLYCEPKTTAFYEKSGFVVCGEFSLHNVG